MLLLLRVRSCADDAEYEMLRQQWDSVNRPRYQRRTGLFWHRIPVCVRIRNPTITVLQQDEYRDPYQPSQLCLPLHCFALLRFALLGFALLCFGLLCSALLCAAWL